MTIVDYPFFMIRDELNLNCIYIKKKTCHSGGWNGDLFEIKMADYKADEEI